MLDRFVGRAFWHAFAGEPKRHLWFVLSEPDGPFLAVCLSMTTRDRSGETLLVIPAGTVIVRGRTAYAPDRDSTIAIAHTLVLTRQNAERAFNENRCAGEIDPEWMGRFRVAVRDGLRFIPGTRRADIELVVATWHLTAEGGGGAT